MSSSRKRIRPSIMYKMQQSIIFRRTEEHHEKCLKEMFRKHYQLTIDGKENKYWTLNLSDSTMEKFRVHLSWVKRLNVFEWSHQNIGNQIITELQNLSVFRSLTNIITKKSSPVDYDYILC